MDLLGEEEEEEEEALAPLNHLVLTGIGEDNLLPPVQDTFTIDGQTPT